MDYDRTSRDDLIATGVIPLKEIKQKKYLFLKEK